jgi:hypothetical protein
MASARIQARKPWWLLAATPPGETQNDNGMRHEQTQGRSADAVTETTAPTTFRQNAPSVAMSEVQYARLKQQIETSATGAATSIWLTLACTCGGIAATILIGGITGDVSASLRGKLEVTAWAGFAMSATLLAVHLAHYREARTRSRAIVTELDTYILRRGPPDQEANSSPVPGSEDSRPNGGEGGTHVASALVVENADMNLNANTPRRLDGPN